MTPAPPRLPKWILKTGIINPFEEKLFLALQIAWAALDAVAKDGYCTHSKEVEKAQRAIRRLGR